MCKQKDNFICLISLVFEGFQTSSAKLNFCHFYTLKTGPVLTLRCVIDQQHQTDDFNGITLFQLMTLYVQQTQQSVGTYSAIQSNASKMPFTDKNFVTTTKLLPSYRFIIFRTLLKATSATSVTFLDTVPPLSVGELFQCVCCQHPQTMLAVLPHIHI